MTREHAIAAAEKYFDNGGFAEDLGRRVAIPTESQVRNIWKPRSPRASPGWASRPRPLPTRRAAGRC
jgi:hypothetical protein